MELRDYVRIVRERWLLILAATLLGTLAAGLVTYAATPTYRATSQIYVSVQTQDGSTQNLAQGSTFSQSQVVGFADLATSPLVLQPVIELYGLDETAEDLALKVNAQVKLNTSLVDVTVTTSSPAEAAFLSNAVAESMSTVLPELQRPLDAAASPVRITVTREAVEPRSQASPNTRTNLALGLLLGLAAGAGIAVLRTVLDTRIRSEADVAAVTQVPVLGRDPGRRAARPDPRALLPPGGDLRQSRRGSGLLDHARGGRRVDGDAPLPDLQPLRDLRAVPLRLSPERGARPESLLTLTKYLHWTACQTPPTPPTSSPRSCGGPSSCPPAGCAPSAWAT